MVRSAAAVLAVLILPSFALAQQQPGTHTVIKDDTLWDLAQRYYQNPFQWRAIYNANTDSIADPNLIYPGEVFVIPGLTGPATTAAAPQPTDQPSAEPMAPTPAETAPVDLVQFGFRQARPTEQVRTIFYTDSASQGSGSRGTADMMYVAVSRDAVYSAPWLVRFDQEVTSSGEITGFARAGDEASTIRQFDRVRIDMPTPARVGAELQIFRPTRTIETVGEVVMPTGVVTVTSIGGDGVIGMVTKEYQRIQPGDLVRPVPAYSLTRGQVAQEVPNGPEAMIMGFAGRQEISDLGHVAFLDLGSDDGIVVGDEFVLFGAEPGARSGSLQVVAVTSNMASARILSMVDDVFHQGVVVRLSRKMR